MFRTSALVLAVLGSLCVQGRAFAQLTPPAGSAGAGNAPISGVPFGPANPRCSATPAALEMPRLYHRSVATSGHTLPFRHQRCLPPVRMRLSQKASHSRAGGIAHRSARSQEFAGGARASMPARMLVTLSSAKPTNAKKPPPLESPEWGFSRRSPLTRPHAAGDAFDELTTV